MVAARSGLESVSRFWAARTARESFPGAPGDGPKAENVTTADLWVLRVEDLVALATVAYVNQFTVHLRNAVVFLTLAPLLLVAAAMSYPLQPHRLLVCCLWGVVVTTAAAAIAVSIQMERNEFLSLVAKTTPNQLSFDRKFVTLILTYLIPILGFVLTQFPEAADLLNSVLTPLSRVVR